MLNTTVKFPAVHDVGSHHLVPRKHPQVWRKVPRLARPSRQRATRSTSWGTRHAGAACPRERRGGWSCSTPSSKAARVQVAVRELGDLMACVFADASW